MFSITLYRRPNLQPLIPLLLSSNDPRFKGYASFHGPVLSPLDHLLFYIAARPFQTHDLALPTLHSATTASTKPQQLQQQPLAPPPSPPIHQLFLLLMPSDLLPAHEASTMERISRFSTLTSAPPPVIALILSPPQPATTIHTAGTSAEAVQSMQDEEGEEGGMQAYMRLQMLLHLPSFSSSTSTIIVPPSSSPPAILPIPTLASLLPILKSYTASLSAASTTLPHPHPLALSPPPPPIPATTAPSPSPLPLIPLPLLLPLLTTSAPSNPLSTHTVNVLSDLCHTIREVAWICEREEGREILRQWLGEREVDGVIGFWEGKKGRGREREMGGRGLILRAKEETEGKEGERR